MARYMNDAGDAAGSIGAASLSRIGFQKGDAVTWYDAGGIDGGTIREVYASRRGAVLPGGYAELSEPSYLVERPDGAEFLKRLAELAPA